MTGPVPYPQSEKQAEQLARLVDWTKAKAVWGAASTALVAGLLVLWTALDNDVVTKQEVIQIVLAVLGVGGVGGGVVYNVPNKAKPKPQEEI